MNRAIGVHFWRCVCRLNKEEKSGSPSWLQCTCPTQTAQQIKKQQREPWISTLDGDFLINLHKSLKLYKILLSGLSKFLNFRFMDPLTNGDYPSSMRGLVKERLPRFSEEEKRLMKGAYDYIGFNYYTTTYAKDVPQDANSSAPPSFSTDSLTSLLCNN